MQRIKIQRQGGKVVFSPTPQMVDAVTDGGSFIFENEDPQQAHFPQADNGTGSWMDQAIAPGQTSTLITANSNGSFPYHCKLHSGEKGQVVAPNVITIQTEMIATGVNPKTQKVNPASDSGLVVFLNLDQSKSHQPQPDNAAQGQWFAQPIAPGAYSPVAAITVPGTYNYHCAIHPDDPTEMGTITVSQPTTT